MPGYDPKCAACMEYRKALASWRIKGGAMPVSHCSIEHRALCKKCQKPHEGRRSGLCDECYSQEPKRPKRYNPLDLVRGKTKVKRII